MMIVSLLVVAAVVACSSADPIFGWYDVCQECPSSEEGDVFTETWCEWMCETIEEQECATVSSTTITTTTSSSTASMTSSATSSTTQPSQNASSTTPSQSTSSTTPKK